MRHLFMSFSIALLTSLLTGCWGGHSVPDLPAAKREVIRYVLTGTYEADIREAIEEGMDFLADLEPGNRRPALVLDVDETAISTWEYQRMMQFGHYYPALQEWRAKAQAPPLKPVLALYNYAIKQGVTVFFVTGRREKDRASTALTLERAGYATYEELIMKPNDFAGESVILFKVAARGRIENRGYHIVLNVGDQESDLLGGMAAKTIKLPNPFYRVQ